MWGTPLVRQVGRYLRWLRVYLVAWRESQGPQGPEAIRGYHPLRPSRLNESLSALISRALFGYPDWGFPWFSSLVRLTPGYTMQIRGTARTPSLQARRFYLSAWKKSFTPSLRLSKFGLRTQTANKAKLIPPITSPGPPGHYSLEGTFMTLILISKSLA